MTLEQVFEKAVEGGFRSPLLRDTRLMETVKMRGFKKVYMITVLEGNGIDEAYREVMYIYDDDTDKMLGVIDPLKGTK